MWWAEQVVIVLILIGAAGTVVGPFLTLSRLTDRLEINGMSIVKDGFVCAGLVPLDDHAVALVDAGNDTEAKALLAELSRRGLDPEDVKVILLTHGHSDHTGGIARFPKAQVMALAEEVDVLEGHYRGGGLIARLSPQKPTGIRLSRTLHDGEVAPLGPLQVRVIALPGHTPGSAAYAIGANLFLGDSANQGKRGRLKSAPWVFSENVPQNQASLLELARRLSGDTAI
ncbi:MAG: MBL fold metallo-hydrolase [Terriglobia bacterium]|jgi:glyoxylase-like metal-dependent hydrolase (beta-lactamase superfamily II)